MKPTDIANPDYFHKVVDCQWACPAHTPVPEYIRLIAATAMVHGMTVVTRNLADFTPIGVSLLDPWNGSA